MTEWIVARSPLPWQVIDDEFDGEEWLWIEDSEGVAVCGFSDPEEGIGDTERADAAYIVHAVNAYPHLVAALRSILDVPELLGAAARNSSIFTIYHDAVIALAAAQETSNDEQ